MIWLSPSRNAVIPLSACNEVRHPAVNCSWLLWFMRPMFNAHIACPRAARGLTFVSIIWSSELITKGEIAFEASKYRGAM